MRYTARLVFILFIFISPAIFAQQQIQAVIREMAGTVEVKQANSDVWEAASRGQSLALDTVISTGFRSTAVIALGDSLITLRPLTRLTILELSRSQGGEKVDLNLQTGRVRADVKSQDTGNTEFTIHSPNSTSSVRGTIFEVDTLSLTVYEGTVEFTGVSGASRMLDDSGVSTVLGESSGYGVSAISGPPQLIDAGGFSQVDEYTGRVSLPTAELSAELMPTPPIASEPISVSAQPPAHVQSTGPSQPPPNPPTGQPSTPPSGQPSKPGDGLVDFGPVIKF
jgi:hypothetical protein